MNPKGSSRSTDQDPNLAHSADDDRFLRNWSLSSVPNVCKFELSEREKPLYDDRERELWGGLVFLPSAFQNCIPEDKSIEKIAMIIA